MIQRQVSTAHLELLRVDINGRQVLVDIFNFKPFYENQDTSTSKLYHLRTPSCMVYKKKKIAYADHLHDRPVVAIQSITAVLDTLVGLADSLRFLKGRTRAAYSLAAVGAQTWRFASEFQRADFRGQGRINAYQTMSAAAILNAVGVILWFDTPFLNAAFLHDLYLLWYPVVFLAVQSLWTISFCDVGQSHTAGAHIAF